MNKFAHAAFALVLIVCIIDVSAIKLEKRQQTVDPAPNARPPPSGYITVHDPAGIVFENSSSRWYLYGTGLAKGEVLASHVSTDGYAWSVGNPIFTEPPQWVKKQVPNNEGVFWAPDIIYLNGLWQLFYAVSSFGSQFSCIAVVVTPTLDPASPDYLWTDFGPVICSTNTSAYNTIDPHVFVDPSTGYPWLNFGSYWQGIFVVQLSGYPVVNFIVGKPVNIATHLDSERSVEASWIQPDSDNNTFWLFVNWDSCCRGVNSTYNIRVGKSVQGPTGPFVDASGVDMLKGGGTLLMGTDGRQIGPGHIGFPVGGPTSGPAGNISAPVISYHYYDANGNPPGAKTLGQATFIWGKWPIVVDRA